MDKVSHLERDASVALATIREWENTFIPTGRIPSDILFHISTHLSSQDDRLRASSVCRHWRRTLLQCAELWSELYLSRGETYTKTLLERAKGHLLDVIVHQGVPAGTMNLLSSHMKQIRCLNFAEWQGIQKFSEITSEPLPLLHALAINVIEKPLDDDSTLPPQPLLNNAVNLEVFRLHSESFLSPSPSLNQFFFPNLVSFDFSTRPWEFHSRQLLDFLEASPMLRTVHMKIIVNRFFQDRLFHNTPEEKIIVLPNVENFNLTVSDYTDGYQFATYISCPSALHTTITYDTSNEDFNPVAIFPPRDLMDLIVRQYTRSTAEEAILETTTILGTITSAITFRSSDATAIKFGFTTISSDRKYEEGVRYQAFIQAAKRIKDHPWANIKRLRICHGLHPCNASDIAGSVERLFKSLGPLDELTIYRCDIQPFFPSFLNMPDITPVTFPPITKLTICNPTSSDSQCTASIVWLAKSHHALGMPLERVIFRAKGIPQGIEEEVRPWVGSFEYYYDE